MRFIESTREGAGGGRRAGLWAGLLVCASLLLLCAVSVSAADTHQGAFTMVEGRVGITSSGADRSVAAREGMGVDPGDVIRTARRSEARISFNDGTMLYIAQRSRVEIEEMGSGAGGGATSVTLLKHYRGRLRSVVPGLYSRPGSRFEVSTPTAVAGVRGTDFTTLVGGAPLATDVFCMDGSVSVRNIDPAVPGAVLLRPGTMTSVAAGRPPTTPVPIPHQLRAALQGRDEGHETIFDYQGLGWDLLLSGLSHRYHLETDADGAAAEGTPAEAIGLLPAGLSPSYLRLDVPVTETEPDILDPSVPQRLKIRFGQGG